MSMREITLVSVIRDSVSSQVTLMLEVRDIDSGGSVPVTIGPIPANQIDGKPKAQIMTFVRNQVKMQLTGGIPSSGIPIDLGEVFDGGDI